MANIHKGEKTNAEKTQWLKDFNKFFKSENRLRTTNV